MFVLVEEPSLRLLVDGMDVFSVRGRRRARGDEPVLDAGLRDAGDGFVVDTT
ncbi:hypothetical protein Airi02_078130 [Actinoallomurus iriomotensis]|uniref:Uncharacterized protein n=1 Tax=Actinoallomurus iriomotensis TaxID=478107 RepID=A0A9W6S9L6_9ACTN|nr:hypothetical protein Airi02_078130 [Actinoallomurus iriomotensis]